MLSFIEGQIKDITLNSLVVKIGGLGLEVFVIPSLLPKLKLGDTICFFTYFHIREDAFELYGFKRKEELSFFKLLISVSGIGPRAALTLLNNNSVGELSSAILSKDVSLLTKVSGIGTKKAERLILELKDKIESSFKARGFVSGDGEVMEALMGLGYSKKDAQEALRRLPSDLTDVESRIKMVLQSKLRKK